jgi:hypothetical protein
MVTPEPVGKHDNWNQYVAEATASIVPFVMPLPPSDNPDDPDEVVVPCPDGDQLDALTSAQRGGDDAAAFVAIFGPDVAARLLLATAKLPFVLRAKMIADVMNHYGMQIASLGESSASSR